ncbi:MAG: nuclear transport factor 2 family protein [Rhodoferax sp.]|nr:nuclear transport factor 2 family protein [Rhodoferax sp.]
MPTQTPIDTPVATREAVTRLVQFFETLTPQSVEQLAQHYAASARFVDPFNDVQGLPAIAHIFDHMFVQLESPRFVVTRQIVQGAQCCLTWDFLFEFKRFAPGTPQTIRGATHLEFSPQGLVLLHRDYWDAAQELYEKLPVVGSLMRWLKKHANS